MSITGSGTISSSLDSPAGGYLQNAYRELPGQIFYLPRYRKNIVDTRENIHI